jgi:4-hydroxy-tetrahydrodipicolinate reductase
MIAPRVALIGYGKMGRALRAMAVDRGWTVTGVVERDKGGLSALAGADVAIEFTAPRAAVANIRAALDAGTPIVVGTTGWYDELPGITAEVEARKGAMLWAPNFSLGALVLRHIVTEAARRLRDVPEMDTHLIETHHAAKRDAPSGTAIALAGAVEPALGRKVPITSVRVGHVPGTHEMIFDAPFEQISLAHTVRDRRVFAAGALLAAEWLINKRGVFTLDDVLTPGGHTT